MKRYTTHFIAITVIFSLNCFGQQTNYVASTENRKSPIKLDKPDEDRVIESYFVVELINMPFGKRITKYEVSKLDMIYTNDLGPNNTRTVTPIYKKKKLRQAATILPSKAIADATSQTIQPIDVEVTAPAYSGKFVNVDILTTYANVLDKGYRSVDMLKKVADKCYFESDFQSSAKYYSELLKLDENLETIYYFRFAQSLKAINEIEKSEEMMRLFESKNLAADIVE